MRNIALKTDFVDELTAAEFNDVQNDIENHVTSSGATLDAGNLFQMAQASVIYAGVSDSYVTGGTDNAIILTPRAPIPGPTSYLTGLRVRFVAAFNNTGLATVNVDGLGVQTIQKDGAALSADDIVAGREITLVYDGAVFDLIFREGQGGVDSIFDLTGSVHIRDLLDVTPLVGTDLLAVEIASSGDTEQKTINEIVAASTNSEFPAGTRMLFQQTAVPIGWTKEASAAFENAGIRGTTGTVTTNTGGASFSAVFTAARGLTITSTIADGTLSGNTGGTAISVAQLPVHNFLIMSTNASTNNLVSTPSETLANQRDVDPNIVGNDERYALAATSAPSTPNAGKTNSVGSGNTHLHSLASGVFTGTSHGHGGSTVDLDLNFYDVVVGIKN